MKCPACGFETPEEQAWCDFCKEPLRKRKAAPAPAPAAGPVPPVAAAKPVPVSDEVWKKLIAVRAEGAPASAPGTGIPPEFAGLDTGGSLPPVPPVVRNGAWIFLGICVLWIFVAIFWMIRNSDRIASNFAATAPLPAAAPASAPVPASAQQSPQDTPVESAPSDSD